MISLFALVLLATASLLVAQTPDSAGIMLETAKKLEVIDGDLRAAIKQYQAIVETFETDRAVVATALVHMAECYEKLGEPQARDVYARVVRDYADQRDVATHAQARLAVVAATAQQDGKDTLRTELQWAGVRHVSPQGDVSPDGSVVTYVDWLDGGNLAIRNLATGEHRRLTHTADGGMHGAYNSRVSPDGEQVLYTWQRRSPDRTVMEFTGELRVLPLQGDRREPHTVWSPAEGSWASIQDWFPSGDRVVAVVSDPSGNQSIVTVPLVDGRVQQVRSIDWSRDPQVRVSPDGRYFAYSRSASREAPEKDILLVAVDGSSESVAIQHAANDELVAWSPDGQHLLFSSDRTGQPGLWAQRVHDGEPAGEPQLLIANLDVGAGMGITRDGTLHYPVRVTRRRLKIAEIDITTGKLLRQPVNVTDRFVGSNIVGSFSPDGETLAYISQRQGWRQRGFVIQSLKTGEERDVDLKLQRISNFSWRRDSGRLVVAGEDEQGRTGTFQVDVATGEIRPHAAAAPDIRGPGIRGQWVTPDGKQILHRNALKNRERIYSYSVADGSVHALPGVFPPGPFTLSPDGQRIATLGDRRSEPASFFTEIRLHPAAGGDGDVLLTTDEDELLGRWITWTPDSTALLVLRHSGPLMQSVTPLVDQTGVTLWRLWVVPVDGSEPVATELVYEPANAGAPPLNIHPDGKRIVYTEGAYFNQFWAVHNLGLD